MKKFTAMLLALLMLALPVMGMAASPSEMVDTAVANGAPLNTAIRFEAGVIPGLDEEIAVIVSDLINAISMTTDQQGGDAPQFDFALQLTGTDVLTLSGAAKGDDIYVKSNLLGEDVMAANGDEAKIIFERLLDMGAEAGMFTANDVAEIKQVIEQAAAQVNVPAVELDVDDLDPAKVIEVVLKLAEKAQTGEVTAQPKNCDPAASMITITLTGDDIADVYDAIFDMMKNSESFMQGFASTFESMNAQMDGEPITAAEFMEKAPAAVREAMGMIQGDVPVVIYLDEEGMPVCGSIAMTMKGENENGETETIAMDMHYDRLTVNDAVNHGFTVKAEDAKNEGVAMGLYIQDSEKLLNVQFNADSLNNGTAQPVIAVNVKQEKEYGETKSEEDTDIAITVVDSDSGEEVGFVIEVDMEAEILAEGVVKAESEMDIALKGMEEELITIKVDQVTGAAAESIAVADAVRPGQMTDEEFAAMVNGLGDNLMNVLIQAMQCLPASTLELMMQ
ncbi:MAG: hypothetical protein J6K13_05350 [Clostridia bacterium]|nr:hypothetical protein [Clostridia bacterium]